MARDFHLAVACLGIVCETLEVSGKSYRAGSVKIVVKFHCRLVAVDRVDHAVTLCAIESKCLTASIASRRVPWTAVDVSGCPGEAYSAWMS